MFMSESSTMTRRTSPSILGSGGYAVVSLERVREQIEKLRAVQPVIHVSFSIPHSKVRVENRPVTITGVYPRVFLVEEQGAKVPRRQTISYTDVLIRQVRIAELEGGGEPGR